MERSRLSYETLYCFLTGVTGKPLQAALLDDRCLKSSPFSSIVFLDGPSGQVFSKQPSFLLQAVENSILSTYLSTFLLNLSTNCG